MAERLAPFMYKAVETDSRGPGSHIQQKEKSKIHRPVDANQVP